MKSGSTGTAGDPPIPSVTLILWTLSSAGVGRTGAFIALSSLLLSPPNEAERKAPVVQASPLGPLPDELKDDEVAQTVDRLREWRGMLVQGPEQMQLIYEMTGAGMR